MGGARLEGRFMRSQNAAAVLSALLYAQALLAFAGLGALVLKDRPHAVDVAALYQRSPL
jgi:hypothetical protein